MTIKRWKTTGQFIKEVITMADQRMAAEVENQLNTISIKSDNEPQTVKFVNSTYWLFKGYVYDLQKYRDKNFLTNEQIELLILESYNKEMRKFERLERSLKSEPSIEVKTRRERIPEDVRFEVWRRDGGMCARPGCGSRVKLEYDHIIPLAKGGSNTARNIELLCEKHNREKSDRIE